MECLAFSIHNIMSPAKCDTFSSSFPSWMLFISFSYLIALAGTSNTMLKKMTKVSVFILFLILEEIISAFHYGMWCLLWPCHIGFYLLRCISSMSALLRVLS